MTVTSKKIVHDDTIYYWSYNPPNWQLWSGLELFRVTNGTVDKIFPTSTGWLDGSLAFIHKQGGYDLYRRIFDATHYLISTSTEFRKQLDDFDNVVETHLKMQRALTHDVDFEITIDNDPIYSTVLSRVGQDNAKRNSEFLLSQLHLNKKVTLYCGGTECVIQYFGPDVTFPYRIYYITSHLEDLIESEYNKQWSEA